MALGPVGLGAVLAISVGEAQAANVRALEELGKRVLFDPISRPRGKQACASCHDPGTGWTGPSSNINRTIVANPGAAFHPFLSFRGRFGRFDAVGTLKPPTSAYANEVQPFQVGGCPTFPGGPPDFCGGAFWNGRAEGVGLFGLSSPLFAGGTETITPEQVFTRGGSLDSVLVAAYQKFLGPVAEQALNPFPNPVEQNIDRESVCKHVQTARYSELYTIAWDEPINCDLEFVDSSFKRIAVALAAYQSSGEVTQYSSKRDLALARDRDKAFPLDGLTPMENYGHDLFYALSFTGGLPDEATRPKECGEDSAAGKAANCTACHNSDAAGDPTGVSPKQFYADPLYHNIGVPLNRQIPNNPGANPGLQAHTGDTAHAGLFRTPTVRNVDKRPAKGFVKAYTHNGWFKSLESLMHFYNSGFIPTDQAAYDASTAKTFGLTRCAGPMTESEAKRANCWPAPETPSTSVLGIVIGDLKLDSCDEKALVAYMKTLTDTKPVRRPVAYRPGSFR